MNKQLTRRRRAARRATARTLAIAAALAALIATLGAGQALAGPDERVLERQARIDNQAASQADKQGKAEEPSQAPSAQPPRRYLRPEPPMDTGPRFDIDEPVAPAPAPPAQDRDRDGLATTLAVVALLLAVGAATTWRIYRRPRPEPTA
jgi:hypothetical protein